MTWKSKKINFLNYDEAIDYLLDEDKLFPIILDGYRYLFHHNLENLDIAEISWGSSQLLNVSINKMESEDTLEKLLKWLEKKERYEECQEILKLKINSKGEM